MLPRTISCLKIRVTIVASRMQVFNSKGIPTVKYICTYLRLSQQHLNLLRSNMRLMTYIDVATSFNNQPVYFPSDCVIRRLKYISKNMPKVVDTNVFSFTACGRDMQSRDTISQWRGHFNFNGWF